MPRPLAVSEIVCLQKGPSRGGVRVQGGEVQLMRANETLLSISALYYWTQWKLECAAFVQRLCLCCVLRDCVWQ